MSAYGYRKPDDLPRVIPVFPLDGALLLPRAPLPLNIFEPRYLNMIDDVFSGERVIGMVQTRPGGDKEKPALREVGCAGRVTSYAETPDGRYLITLTGVARFRVEAELRVKSPYRQVTANFAPFARDLEEPPAANAFDRDELMGVLKDYLHASNLDAEWSSVETAPPETLVNSLAMVCPFTPADKQALLEAATLAERRDALIALMRFAAAGGPDGDNGVQ